MSKSYNINSLWRYCTKDFKKKMIKQAYTVDEKYEWHKRTTRKVKILLETQTLWILENLI